MKLKKKKVMNKKVIKLTLIKSGIGRKSDQKRTLIGLGLTKFGKVNPINLP